MKRPGQKLLMPYPTTTCGLRRCFPIAKTYFTITAEIYARSLANFYCQYADRHMNFKIHATLQRARAGNSTICYRKKQIDVSY